MGTTGSTPATSASDKKGHQSSRPSKRPAATPPVKHHSSSSSPALKKGPKNYVDMGIEDDNEAHELGECLEVVGKAFGG